MSKKILLRKYQWSKYVFMCKCYAANVEDKYSSDMYF